MGQYDKAYKSYSKALNKLDMSEDVDNYAYCLKKMKLCQTKMNSNNKHIETNPNKIDKVKLKHIHQSS